MANSLYMCSPFLVALAFTFKFTFTFALAFTYAFTSFCRHPLRPGELTCSD